MTDVHLQDKTSPISPPASALVRKSVRRTLFGMALPMLAGTFAMNAYHLADTWFVARLGTGLLAAMGFAFPVVSEYMAVWYGGAVFMTLPMLGNGILIAAGDSKGASGLMILGTTINRVLDPIMIFGLAGCPAVGIRGAAVSTIISQGIATAWLIHLLFRKHRLLQWNRFPLSEYARSLSSIARFAGPSILSMILMPVSATVITRLLSRFGHEAVAAGGAASRIEMFAFMVPMALGISLTPFVSQNFGAERMDRVRISTACEVCFWDGC